MLAYSFRPNIFARERFFRLERDGLALETHGAESTVPYAEITQIQFRHYKRRGAQRRQAPSQLALHAVLPIRRAAHFAAGPCSAYRRQGRPLDALPRFRRGIARARSGRKSASGDCRRATLVGESGEEACPVERKHRAQPVQGASAGRPRHSGGDSRMADLKGWTACAVAQGGTSEPGCRLSGTIDEGQRAKSFDRCGAIWGGWLRNINIWIFCGISIRASTPGVSFPILRASRG